MCRVNAIRYSFPSFLAPLAVVGVSLLGPGSAVATKAPDPGKPAALQPDPELTGEWVGHADSAPIPLEIQVRLKEKDEEWVARVAIPREGLRETPAEDVEVTEGSVEILLPGGQAELHLGKDGERLEGFLEGMSGTLDVTLVRPDSPEADAMSREVERAREEARGDPLQLAGQGAAHGRVDGDALGERSEITVRHLLNHTSGLESPTPTQPIYESRDFVRFALESSLTEEPGSEIRYNNNATNLLAGVLGKVAGGALDTFLRDDLFQELGITEFDWSRDPAGNPHGMAGLQIHAGDLARLGQLALQEGTWDGEELIDPEWFRKSLQPGSPHSEDVGLLWQLLQDDDQASGEAPAGFMHSGYLGQHLVIYPEERLVGVRMVEESPAYDPATDSFEGFPERLRGLTR